jgi:hypothetical protein
MSDQRPNPVRVISFGVRIILAVTRETYKAPTNFVFFVLAENDNNYERVEMDFGAANSYQRQFSTH